MTVRIVERRHIPCGKVICYQCEWPHGSVKFTPTNALVTKRTRCVCGESLTNWHREVRFQFRVLGSVEQAVVLARFAKRYKWARKFV